MPANRMRRQRGIALMLVMWVLTLLTVMAVSMTAAQRTETALTDNHVAETRFRMLCDAAIAYTALRFMTQPPESDVETALAMSDDAPQAAVWQPNGIPRNWRFAGSEVSISVFNELSRINLNQAELPLLAALLEHLEVPEETAGMLAAAIVDWRDEDDLTQLNGAEDSDYRKAGMAFGARDEPFTSIEELRQVLGMTPEIYRRLAPEVTLAGEGDALAEEFASPVVLAATRGISLEDAQLEIARRETTTVPGARAPRTLERGGPLYRILASERTDERHGRRMAALIELTPGQQPPYLVHWRRFGLGEDTSPNVADELDSEAASE